MYLPLAWLLSITAICARAASRTSIAPILRAALPPAALVVPSSKSLIVLILVASERLERGGPIINVGRIDATVT